MTRSRTSSPLTPGPVDPDPGPQDPAWQTRRVLKQLLSVAIFAAILPAQELLAGHVATDGTVGAATTLTGPNFSIPATLGRQVGPNLFHSFNTFSLDQGETATFTASASTKAILARVTGGSVSTINGTIATRLDTSATTPHPAAFYLINPAGVIFGPNAVLDVGGSFVVTTADTVQLADGGHFDASNPATSLLTSAAPAAFGFVKTSPAPVTVNGGGLGVPSGHALSILGGSGTTIQNAFLVASIGRINIAAVGGSGNVIGDAGDPAAALGFDPQLLAGNVSITGAHLAVGGAGGGAIAVRAADLGIVNSTFDVLNSGSSSGAGITVNASGDFNLTGGSLLLTASSGTGSGGDISIHANNITVNASSILTNTNSAAPSGNITLVADTSMSFLSQGAADSLTSGSASAGNVSVSAQHVLIDAQTTGKPTGLSSGTEASGNAGNINVVANDLTLQNLGSSISSDSDGAGNAGSITINANSVVLNQEGTLATETFSGGNAGLLQINTSSFSADGGLLEAGVGQTDNGTANGAGGTLIINASSRISLSSTDVLATTDLLAGNTAAPSPSRIALSSPSITLLNNSDVNTSTNAASAGGPIELTGTNIKVAGDSAVSSSTFGSGNAGNITVTASGRLTIQGVYPSDNLYTGLFAEAVDGTGGGGDVSVSARSIRIFNFGIISAISNTSGPAGNIQVSTTRNISLALGAINIRAEAEGGDINVVSHGGNLSLQRDSFISAEAEAGGNISVDAAGTIRILNSTVTARAQESGGQITIGPPLAAGGGTVSPRLPLPQGIVLNSSTINGLVADGTRDLPVRIRADQFLASSDSQILSNATLAPPEYDIAGSLVPLTGSLALPGARLVPQCGQLVDLPDLSSFIVTGYGGAPPEPGGWITGDIIRRRQETGR